MLYCSVSGLTVDAALLPDEATFATSEADEPKSFALPSTSDPIVKFAGGAAVPMGVPKGEPGTEKPPLALQPVA